jgi:hypothetical protein
MKNMKGKVFGALLAISMVSISFSLLVPPAMAMPVANVVISDAADGIGTVYEDGGGAGAGLLANCTAWVHGHDLTNQFNVAQSPEEIPDGGMDFSIGGPGYDWFSYDMGSHWAMGDGFVMGEVARALVRLESGQTYTHMGVVVSNIYNYSACVDDPTDPANPEWWLDQPALEPIIVDWHDGTALQWSLFTDPENVINLVGWNVYNAPAASDPTVRGSYALVATYGPAVNTHVGTLENGAHWVVEPLWDNTGGIPAAYANYLFSNYTNEPAPPGGMPPEITLSGDAGNHDGNVLLEEVAVTCTVDDSMHAPPDIVTGARVQVTTPGAMVHGPYDMAMTSGGGTSVETFSFPFSWDSMDMIANDIVEGTYGYEMIGQDAVDGWNATYSALGGTFDIVDTTPPECTFMGATPPDGAFRQTGDPPGYIGPPAQTVDIEVLYRDFTAWSSATLYWGNASEGAPAVLINSVAMIEVAFAWGSYDSTLQGSFQMYGAPGDTIWYEVDVEDSSAGGPLLTSSGQQTVIPFAAAAQPQDPYPIYGYTFQYDGTIAAGYGPTLITGCTVDVTWANTSSGAWSTITYVDALATGQYSVDILNYSEGGVVFCNVTVNPIWGNLGYNYTYVEALGAFPGGREQNITCGVPYNISWVQPIAGANVFGGLPFSLEWIITDIDGLLAPGYYNTALETPDRGFVNISAGPIPPVLHSYIAPADVLKDGTVDPDPGHFQSLIPAGMTIYFPGGLWWLNVSEGGQIFPDTFYLTPWDAWWLDPALSIPGWIKDWDNITINVQVAGFDWELIAGWNLVSCPQNFTHRVDLNLYMDAQDALNWTNMYMINVLLLPGDPALEMADNLGGIPSAYASYALDTGEGGAFMIDCQHSYWVWTDLAGPNIIHFDSLNETTNAGPDLQSVDLVAGWNMMGFQHNFTAWTVIPTASMFTDGTVDTTGALDIAGPLWRIIVTEWTDVKWYNSCVVTDWFPVMADKNWLWDFSYSAQPGNGVWIWVDAATTYVYSTVF